MDTETTPAGEIENWTPEETAAALSEGRIVLIDVRTPQEFALERIEGALLMPMQGFDPANLPEEGEKRIVLHCGSGIRSKKVGEQILDAGADRIAHVAGGIGAWKNAGLEYIATDPATGGPVRKTAG